MLTKPRIRIVVPYQPRVAYAAARTVCWPALPPSSGGSGGAGGMGDSSGGSGNIVCLPTYGNGGADGPVNSDSMTCFKVG